MTRKFTPAQRRIIAYHEAGHALANYALGYEFIDAVVHTRPYLR
jgi:ATP-dependent Zn protease